MYEQPLTLIFTPCFKRATFVPHAAFYLSWWNDSNSCMCICFVNWRRCVSLFSVGLSMWPAPCASYYKTRNIQSRPGYSLASNKLYYHLMPSTWIHVFSLCLSLSPPEFHTNHRRISLQAPRSHQLPSATFCHTLSEGRYLNMQLLQKACLLVWSDQIWKTLSKPRPRCAYLWSWYFSLFLYGLFASLSRSCI